MDLVQGRFVRGFCMIGFCGIGFCARDFMRGVFYGRGALVFGCLDCVAFSALGGVRF